jgi:hypothetical protein
LILVIIVQQRIEDLHVIEKLFEDPTLTEFENTMRLRLGFTSKVPNKVSYDQCQHNL